MGKSPDIAGPACWHVTCIILPDVAAEYLSGTAADEAPFAVLLTTEDLAMLADLAEARSREEARRQAAALVRAQGARGASPELARLVASLLGLAGEAEDLRRQAALDPLTGIANRRAFEESLERDVAQANRRDGWLAVGLLDLDGFKELNDSAGHAAGDQALIEVARAIEATLRRGDLVARLGGDEFAVLLPDTSRGRAERVMERLRAAIGARRVADHPLAASVGVAAEQGPAIDPTQLLEAADQALYRDKRERRRASGSPPRDETTYAFQQSSLSTRVLRRKVPVPSPSASASSQ
ncbi:MAG TPA: GGDEF domain-containing protein [Polyangiaceae bacterium LLY-WYZ-14_1]|nr:GGDEF domain-containing protein [Polyangiaceae bacterium LLY-WYZ-14_1]